ncbi:hypothetical protein RUND412_010374 [Rhizina undulata]
MAHMTRAQRRKAAVRVAPAPTITTPPNNLQPPTLIALSTSALSTSDHSMGRITRSAAHRLYPPSLTTPIKAPMTTFTSSAPLTLEEIAANQEILSQNVAELHDRMEQIENRLDEVMKWEFSHEDSAKICRAGPKEKIGRGSGGTSKRPGVGDSPKTRMTKDLLKERKGQGKPSGVLKCKAEG